MSGLSKRVHETSTLKAQFRKLVESIEDRETNETTLQRRVATRWNSNLICLRSHVELRTAVEQLTAVAKYKLQAYQLSLWQWQLAGELSEVLEVRQTDMC